MIRLIETSRLWLFGSDVTTSGGLLGRVTVCRLDDGTRFAVRENVTSVPSFYLSSGERWGDKRGAMPSSRRQALELLAPAERWGEIAAIVAAVDDGHRPVLWNARFTWHFIERLLESPEEGSR